MFYLTKFVYMMFDCLLGSLVIVLSKYILNLNLKKVLQNNDFIAFETLEFCKKFTNIGGHKVSTNSFLCFSVDTSLVIEKMSG